MLAFSDPHASPPIRVTHNPSQRVCSAGVVAPPQKRAAMHPRYNALVSDFFSKYSLGAWRISIVRILLACVRHPEALNYKSQP